MGQIKIENLVGKGVQAKIINGGKQYDTYYDFANAAGYPSAAGRDVVRANSYEGEVVNVLAKGNHEYEWTTIYVCETAHGYKFLIGKEGIELIEPTSTPTLQSATIDQLMDELKRRVEGVTLESDDSDTLIAEFTPEPSPLRTRANVVERAQFDVQGIVDRGSDYSALGGDGNHTYRTMLYNVEFIVNKEKRTVVALVRAGKRNNGQTVIHKGIAKCDPNDCFNEHIGKAIAVRRAFELDVPNEYLNAPAPKGIMPGDVVRGNNTGRKANVDRVSGNKAYGTYANGRDLYSPDVTVIDDSARY